jgi:hypothetical protein
MGEAALPIASEAKPGCECKYGAFYHKSKQKTIYAKIILWDL